MTPPEALTPSPANRLEIDASRQFTAWMAEQKVSLAFTTYQAGKLFYLGLQADEKLAVFERTFNRCMGLCKAGNSLYMSSLYQFWRMENVLEPGQLHQGHDALYVPQVGWITGDLDIHDIGVDADGQVIFVNSLFSCLATLSETHSFDPVWKPPFISKLAAEDRCHLNGLALRDGQPRYVTMISQTDVHEGWREHRRNGGIVMDITTNKVICSGLSMPHSPRYYQDKIYLLNSGTGEFGYVDETTGQFKAMVFCPGYLRGLSFIGDFAVVGLSKPRENKTFNGLVLQETLEQKQIEARCGIYIIDLRNGDIVHSLRIEGVVEELYDVITLENTVRPMGLGFKNDEIRRLLRIGPGQH